MALLAAAFLLSGCAHTVGTRDGAVPHFDLRRPHCEPAAKRPGDPGPDSVLVQYLGAGGLYLEWQGEAVLLGPFFSNPRWWRVGFGRIRPRTQAIDDGLIGVEAHRVGALLIGHSHYDHLGDLPWIAERMTRARAYANRTGCDALRHYAGEGGVLSGRLDVLEELGDGAVQLRDAKGRPLPFRLRRVAADHAPHFGRFSLMKGTGRVVEGPWEKRRYWSLKEGQSYAFVLDLTDGIGPGAAVRFRLLYQDSAGVGLLDGLDGLDDGDDEGFDLAAGCVASSHLVEGYPQRLLEAARPRHLLVTHYDHFLKPRDRRRSFVPLLTRQRANRFLRSAGDAWAGLEEEPAPPVGPLCGVGTDAWTLPLVGEWLVFEARPPRRDEP